MAITLYSLLILLIVFILWISIYKISETGDEIEKFRWTGIQILGLILIFKIGVNLFPGLPEIFLFFSVFDLVILTFAFICGLISKKVIKF
ncbi:MAG: hypothetical protein IPM42_05060 [Saprospiraceae bacterium]|nr:hypothetical protein [Saprospiraceae bacterium]